MEQEQEELDVEDKLVQIYGAQSVIGRALVVYEKADDLGKGGGPWLVAKFIKHYGRRRTFVWTTIIAWGGAAFFQYLCSFTLEADERKIRERGEATDAPVARHSWLAKQSSADLESEFRDAADETTSLLHRPRSRFDTGQFSFRDAAQ